MDFKENDLVLLRVPNEPEYSGRQRHYSIWVRVLFKDDKTSNGKIERCPSFACGGYYANKKGDMVQFENTKVLEVFNDSDGKQWCYSDDVTRCDCPGLCRNK